MAKSLIPGRVMRRLLVARERGAMTTFMLGSVSASDRLLTGLYFGLFARKWGGFSVGRVHLEAYRAGLEHCGEPAALLDVGTGAGGSANVAAARYPQARIVGLDISRSMLRQARKRYSAPNLEFRRGSVLALPFEDRTFDVVTSLNAIAEPGEVRRVLRPGGLMLTASSMFPLRDEASAWVGRWRDAGFKRLDAADLPPGSWELYRRTEEA
jgi:SAM-dependent methyltransferase